MSPSRLAPIAVALLLSACSAVIAPPPAPQRPLPPPAQPPAAPLSPAEQASRDKQRRAEFDQQLQRWHGADAKELRSKLGPPSSTQRNDDGRTVYVYDKSSSVRGPGGQQQPFKCVVGYVLDTAGVKVSTHWFDGC